MVLLLRAQELGGGSAHGAGPHAHYNSAKLAMQQLGHEEANARAASVHGGQALEQRTSFRVN